MSKNYFLAILTFMQDGIAYALPINPTICTVKEDQLMKTLESLEAQRVELINDAKALTESDVLHTGVFQATINSFM